MTPDPIVSLAPAPAWSTTLPGADVAARMRGPVQAPRRICDGHLYPSTLHSLMGEPETGKTTIAAWWASQLLSATNPVVWLDEESGGESIAERLLAIGTDPDDVAAGFHFVEFPSLGWTDQHVGALRALIDDLDPALIVFDSAAGFLGAAGLAENDNDAVGSFYKRVLLRAARYANAAVLVLDHVTKTSEGVSRYARGAGAKLAYVDVAYSLERIRPFSRTESGALRLVVRKDRRGWLHRQHDIVVDVDDGRIDLRIDESMPALSDDYNPSTRKILEALTDSDEPLSNTSIVNAIVARHGHGLKRETVSRGLNQLLADGLVDSLDDGYRGAKKWLTTIRPEGVTSRD